MGVSGRLPSADSSYYPTLDEVLSSTDDDLNKYLNKTVKGNVVSLFKELINRCRDNGTIKTEIGEMKVSGKGRRRNPAAEGTTASLKSNIQ